MIRKLFITPWFGPLPPWMEHYWESARRLQAHGYDWLFTSDLEDFRRRVREKLGIGCPIVPGSGKLHDFRPALGLLYEDELRGYDFWGHTDFDCVYGNPSHFASDEFLSGVDLHSDCPYVCGPWSLFRANHAQLTSAFLECSEWREAMENPESSGWAEKQFSALMDRGHAEGRWRRRYTDWQGMRNPQDSSQLRFEDGCLYDGQQEILFFHFRHIKRWPQQLVAA